MSKENNKNLILDYCVYCHDPVYENEGHIYIEGKGYFHYDKINRHKNCYFVEEEDLIDE